MLQNAGVLYILTYKCASRHSGVRFLDIGTSKIGPALRFLCILTCKCASRHSGVRFLDIWPCKIGPRVWCFAHFGLQMCLARQGRAIFGHLTFKNWSDRVVFCAFWVANVLRATAACHFLTSEPAKSVPQCGVLCILTWKMCFAPQRRAIF